MGLGKINTFIDIILVERIKDDEGFSKVNDNILASIRAYKEERHASEKWANRALFSAISATELVIAPEPNFAASPATVALCQ